MFSRGGSGQKFSGSGGLGRAKSGLGPIQKLRARVPEKHRKNGSGSGRAQARSTCIVYALIYLNNVNRDQSAQFG